MVPEVQSLRYSCVSTNGRSPIFLWSLTSYFQLLGSQFCFLFLGRCIEGQLLGKSMRLEAKRPVSWYSETDICRFWQWRLSVKSAFRHRGLDGGGSRLDATLGIGYHTINKTIIMSEMAHGQELCQEETATMA
ncbi:hypothetical protein M441DRAFT_73119 [Trichoderma asperellum CBS 433.97]|uniref:Uncharacterized protein n=1 Tax=Trichoderma asperellum (strain ATCC 204424 / CBS 433.97 / NBRC 101777) TaxID=1042311 RepID=A0A2T3YUR2_TRIA4|nr:hypothetical protein M441DRAFT_73119 [Trichoderma asperellum CBS 433.97]PTB36312.1 hypothetical protein M441DRAFT_73119 [Trichoderma asperellum CBS 433.97]